MVRDLPGEQAHVALQPRSPRPSPTREIATLKADWTRQDPRITAELASLGRNAVPVYALYVPGESRPRLLPEVLTPSLVLAAIDTLPPRSTAITQR